MAGSGRGWGGGFGKCSHMKILYNRKPHDSEASQQPQPAKRRCMTERVSTAATNKAPLPNIYFPTAATSEAKLLRKAAQNQLSRQSSRRRRRSGFWRSRGRARSTADRDEAMESTGGWPSAIGVTSPACRRLQTIHWMVCPSLPGLCRGLRQSR